MIKDMLEAAIGRKVDSETFKLALDMTTDDIKFHNISFKHQITKMDYVLQKLVESVTIAERLKEYISSNKEIKKDSLQTA